MSRTHESNVFTPYSRCVHSGVSFGLGTVRVGGGARFACERVMGSSWFSVFEVFSRILTLGGHVTVGGYGFWKITSKTHGDSESTTLIVWPTTGFGAVPDVGCTRTRETRQVPTRDLRATQACAGDPLRTHRKPNFQTCVINK